MDKDLERTEELLAQSKKQDSKKKRVVAIVCILIAVCVAGMAGNTLHKHNVVAKSLDQGEKYMAESDYKQAVEAYTAAIEIDSKNAEAFEKRGDAYMRLGKSKEAAKDYVSAIKNNKADEELCRKGISAAVSSGDEELLKAAKAAVEDSNESIDSDDMTYGMYVSKALDAYKSGRYDEAKMLSSKVPQDGSYIESCVSKMTDEQKSAFSEKVREIDESEKIPAEDIDGIWGYFLTDFDNDGAAELIIETTDHQLTSRVVYTVYKYDEEKDAVNEIYKWGGRNVWITAYPDHEGVIMSMSDTSYLAYFVVTKDGTEEMGSRTLDVDKIEEQMIDIGLKMDSKVLD